MENTIISEYNVREALVYAATRRMWMNCQEQQDVFAGKRAIYTDTYIAGKISAIDTAEALPNDVQRTTAHEVIRIKMATQADVCCDEFQMLKLYLRHAYSKNEFDTMYDQAGGGLYEEASRNNWITLKAMLEQGSKFISTNKTALMANENMPTGFEDVYNEQKDLFFAMDTDYTTARQQATQGAAAKVEANNAIYNACIAMGLDGQQFFKSSPLRSQFSFDAVCGMLSPAGASTAVITVVDSETEKPLEAIVTDQWSERTVTTDKQTGKAEFGNLSAEETGFSVQAQGYGTQVIPLTLKTGTTSRVTVKLVSLVLSSKTGVSSNEMRMPVPENGMTEIGDGGSGSGQEAVAVAGVGSSSGSGRG